MIELAAGAARCLISPSDGGRLAGLTVGGYDLILRGCSADDPLHWGSYPMVPWAGRIDRGRFSFENADYSLPIILDGHAIHGTAYREPWHIDSINRTEITLWHAFGPSWPFGGEAEQRIEINDNGLDCHLSVTAGDQAMPVSLGWHPWFTKPVADDLHFTEMYERSATGIPTGQRLEPKLRPWDDCFTGPVGPLTLSYPGLSLTVSSDCDHWVVYDEPSHATCVEPQTAPPNAFNMSPMVLQPGEKIARVMRFTWQILTL